MTDKEIVENYYIEAGVAMDVKLGATWQSIPSHSNPGDYGLSEKDMINLRLRYFRLEQDRLQNKYNKIKMQYIKDNNPFGCILLNDLQEEINKRNKDIKYCLKLPEKQKYNIEDAKKVPLNQIVKILPSGFFVENPFRNEKSPSNSLHWDKKTNRFYDFGSGQSGDSIDLIMEIYKCSMVDALKRLISL